MLVCPVTNQAKEYPFEVVIPDDQPVAGVVLADQVRSIDWKARRAERITRAPDAVLEEVLAKLAALAGF